MASPWVQLRSQLEALLDSFEHAMDKPAAGRRLLEAATDFQQAAEALLDEPRVATSEADATVQALCVAGERLAALDSLARGRYPHIEPAAVLVETCMGAATHLHARISPACAQRILQSLQLLLGSGAACLRKRPGARQPGARGRAARHSSSDPAEPLTSLVPAVCEAVNVAHSYWPSCIDGLATSVLAPQPLLGWLTAAVETAQRLDAADKGIGAQVVSRMSSILYLLCDHAAFEEHAQQLQQDAQLCSSLTGLLIEAHWTSVGVFQQLVARSDAQDAAADWVIAAELAAVLASAMLHLGAESLARAAGRGDRGAAHSLASQLEASARMLHLATTAGTAEELGPWPLSCFARQLGSAAWYCYESVRLRQEATPGMTPIDGLLEVRQSSYLLPAVPAIVRLMQAALSEPASGAGSASGTASAAEVSALSPVAAAAGRATASARSQVASLVIALDGVLHHLQPLMLCTTVDSGSRRSRGGECSSSASSLEAWCEAACATLRALPTLGAAMQQAADVEAAVMRNLADQICAFTHDAVKFVLMLPASREQPVPATEGALGASQRSLWQLHTASVRLCHWLASTGLQQLPHLRPQAADLLSTAALPLVAAAALHHSFAVAMSPAQLKRSRRALSAMAVAHFEAQYALLRALQPNDLHGSEGSDGGHMAAIALELTLELGPACLAGATRLLDMFRWLVPAEAHVLEHEWISLGATGTSTQQPQERTGLLRAAQRHARTAALLLTSPSMLDEAAIDLLLRKDLKTAITLTGLFGSLVDAAGSECAAATAGDTLSLLEAVAAASTQLGTAMHGGVLQMLEQRGPAAQREPVARGLNSCLPAARQLAAALLAWWGRPAQQRADALDLAAVAAVRSCAYLGCANLGGEGGPAAGEGTGSKRCSACRAVWYCGTACSHGSWRAGHKHVCAELGAVRRERKQRRRQGQQAEV